MKGINMCKKQCIHCKQTKIEIDFAKKRKKHSNICIECQRAYYRKRWIDKGGKEKRKNWSLRNVEKDRMYKKKYRDNNKLKGLEYQKTRRKEDVGYKIKGNLRHRLWNALQGLTKSKPTLVLLGCSVEELKTHLQSQFLLGMTWENYGLYKTKNKMTWHIDHIRPCSSFDLRDSEQQKQCFHFTNLQPLWAFDNISKSDKYVGNWS
jgi:hypothetical protein